MMILFNFSHPLLPAQLNRIAELSGGSVERVIEVDSQVDPQTPLAPQVSAMANRCGLSPVEWQTLPMLIVLPSLNFSAALLLAEIHGRAGHFPTIVRIKPVVNEIATVYEVAELINLQTVRDDARQQRQA